MCAYVLTSVCPARGHGLKSAFYFALYHNNKMVIYLKCRNTEPMGYLDPKRQCSGEAGGFSFIHKILIHTVGQKGI